MKDSKSSETRNSVNYIKADKSHAALISQLINSAYRGESSRVGWTTEADLMDGERIDEAGVKDLIEQKESVFIIALKADELVACVHAKKEGSDCLYFGLLAVQPGLQAQGIGKGLMNELKNLATSWGLKKLRLTVINHREDIIPYYQRLGFKLTGKTEPFPMPELAKVSGIKLLEMIKDL